MPNAPVVSDTLAKICAKTRDHIEACKAAMPFADLQARLGEGGLPRGFVRALEERHANGQFALIAEIKKASPSKGLIRPDFDPPLLAEAYKAGGATCLSVLTDRPFFQGHDDYLIAARAAVDLPCLRKDFMLDPYQIVESRVLGADCVLLIMACLSDGQAQDLLGTATELGMDALIEVHDEDELERALELPSPLIGINNRNLKTLEVSLETFKTLARQVPENRLLVAESGLYSHVDLIEMSAHGARAYLVGESLMRQENVTAATKDLLGISA